MLWAVPPAFFVWVSPTRLLLQLAAGGTWCPVPSSSDGLAMHPVAAMMQKFCKTSGNPLRACLPRSRCRWLL